MLLRVSLIFEETSINLISGFTLVLVCLVTFKMLLKVSCLKLDFT